MKKLVKLILGLVISAGALLVGVHVAVAAPHYVQSSTPTIFVHGGGSSYRAEEYMTHAARNAGVTQTIVRADVSKQGQVAFTRQLPAHAVNPIIEVNLADNTLGGYKESYQHGGRYIKDVVVALEKQHHYAHINLVGHSMGNLEIINYINDNANNHQLPQVAHLVAIAGHYDSGVWEKRMMNVKVNPRTGKPNKMDAPYRHLLGLRHKFPTNTRVLNIYGNLEDGSHADGDVPVNSAKSLKYLVATRAKSYREFEVRGKDGQHSKLHHNDRVNRELIKFLWEK